MKSVVLALLATVFTCTTHAAPIEEKPLSNYLATATANTFNRLKTVGNYTKWIANRVPPDQMKDFKAYLKEKGLKPTTKFPKMTAKNETACFQGTEYCMVFSDDSVSINGASFTVERKPFRQVVEGVCSKIGCDKKTAMLTLIPEAHAALDQSGWTLLGIGAGALIGNLAAESLGTTKTKGTIAGALLGGIGAYVLSDENKHACGRKCDVQWSPGQCQYQITPQPQPVPTNYYGQQQPPYYMPPQVYHQTYGQPYPPCDRQPSYYRPGATDLQIALNTPQYPTYCNSQCSGTTLPGYVPPDYTTIPGYQQGSGYTQPGTPADVRNVQSEEKKK